MLRARYAACSGLINSSCSLCTIATGTRIAAKSSAEQGRFLQAQHNEPVVFLKVDGGFIAQPVKLGRSDGKRVEVLSGLKAGMPYASTGSFVVKSELGKGSAEHTH